MLCYYLILRAFTHIPFILTYTPMQMRVQIARAAHNRCRWEADDQPDWRFCLANEMRSGMQVRGDKLCWAWSLL